MSGNVWMFSDEIDDEDLEFMSHDYVTYNMACEYYRLGIKPVVRMAHEAGAVYKIGKKVLIRRSIIPINCTPNPWKPPPTRRPFHSVPVPSEKRPTARVPKAPFNP